MKIQRSVRIQIETTRLDCTSHSLGRDPAVSLKIFLHKLTGLVKHVEGNAMSLVCANGSVLDGSHVCCMWMLVAIPVWVGAVLSMLELYKYNLFKFRLNGHPTLHEKGIVGKKWGETMGNDEMDMKD
jgi:hypothetical protein